MRLVYSNMGGAKIDEIQSRTIDFLRFPLAFLVIFIHSFGEPPTENPDIEIATYDNIRIFFSHIVSRVSVPLFYLFSGYLFFYKIDEFNSTIYLNKIKSRCKTILIPYFVWNLLFILYNVATKTGKGILNPEYDTLSLILTYFNEHGWLNMFWACEIWPFRSSWFGWDLYSSGPIMIPLWFLRDLMVIIVLSYFLYIFIKRFGKIFLCLLFICYITGLWPNIPGLSLSCIFFFCLGAYMSINKNNMLKEFSKYYNIIIWTTLFLIILMIIYKSDFTYIGRCIYPLFSIFGVISTFIVTGYCVANFNKLSLQPLLSRASFFIYVSHTFLILGICTNLWKMIIPDGNVFLMTVRYFLIPVTCVIVCLVVYMVMEKYIPNMLSLLTGNRVAPKNLE